MFSLSISLTFLRLFPYEICIKIEHFSNGLPKDRPEYQISTINNFLQDFSKMYKQLYLKDIPFLKWFNDEIETYYDIDYYVYFIQLSSDVNYLYNCMSTELKKRSIDEFTRRYGNMPYEEMIYTYSYNCIYDYGQFMLDMLICKWYPIIRDDINSLYDVNSFEEFDYLIKEFDELIE
jgi:hypothetical protein